MKIAFIILLVGMMFLFPRFTILSLIVYFIIFKLIKKWKMDPNEDELTKKWKPLEEYEEYDHWK